MTENPYQPSLVPPWTPPVQERRGISVLAIFLGVLTDIGGSILGWLVLSVAIAAYVIAVGGSFDEIAIVYGFPQLWIPSFVFGMGLRVLGGFVAGRVAKRSEILHGVATGLISALLRFLIHLWQSAPIWYAILSFLIVPPLAMLGARLSMIGRRQQVAKETP